MTDDTLRAALDALVRSAQGRCSNPRCPSQHVGAGQDCIDFAFAAALAASAPDDPMTDDTLRAALRVRADA